MASPHASSSPIDIPQRKKTSDDDTSFPRTSPHSPCPNRPLLGRFLEQDLRLVPSSLPSGSRPRAVSASIAALAASDEKEKQWTNSPSPEKTMTFSPMSLSQLPRQVSPSMRRQSLLQLKRNQQTSQATEQTPPPKETDAKKDKSADKEVVEVEEEQTMA
jgi:hypothetical protein